MKHIVYILVFLVSSTSALCAQVPREKDEMVRSMAELYAWTTEPWKGNHAAYRQTRIQIEAAIANKKDMVALAQRYYVQAEADLLNPLKQFRWAYASYQASRVVRQTRVNTTRPLLRLQQFRGPYNFEFSRLRFILEAKTSPRAELKPIARRLAERSPNDYDILFYTVAVLDPSKSRAEKQEALTHCQTMLKLAPNRSSAHTSLGFTYFRSWLTSKSRDDGKRSIAAYEKYLKIAPRNDPFRPQAQRLIAMIRSGLSSQ